LPQLPTRLPLARGTQGIPPSLPPVAYGTFTPLVGRSRTVRLKGWLLTRRHQKQRTPTTPAEANLHWFGLLPVRSPLLGELFLFLGVLRCFSSPGARSSGYVFPRRRPAIPPGGLPHSETTGSACQAAPRCVSPPYRVLLRPLLPRHPPRALPSLTCTQSPSPPGSLRPRPLVLLCVPCLFETLGSKSSRRRLTTVVKGHPH
jgi:hypothetical protein